MPKLAALLLLALVASACDGGGVIQDGALTAPGILLGERVALDDDVALLGAPASNDAVVFERGPDGWVSVSRLSPTEARVPDPFFGQFLDLDGEIAVLGAPENDVALDAPGHAYVYARGEGAWTEEAVLRPDDLSPDANFGWAVSVSGGVVAVGAGDDADDGRVHVFERAGGGWARTATLTHPSTDENRGAFGKSVALDGGRLAVGALAGSVGVDGRIYVYERNGVGEWVLDDTIEAPPLPFSARFTPLLYGDDVALDGPTLAVNEPGRDGGTVYVYRQSAAGWALEATLVRSREELGRLATFGSRIALSGDRLVASVPAREIGGELKGAAIVYVRSPDGTWAEEAELQLPDPVFGFGRDVDIDGDTVLVGANNTDSVGGAYLFRRGADGWAVAE